MHQHGFRSRRARAVAGVVVLLSVVPLAAAEASTSDEESALPNLPFLEEDEQLHASVRAMAVESEAFDKAVAEYLKQRDIFTNAEADVVGADSALVDLRDSARELAATIEGLRFEEAEMEVALVDERSDLAEIALNAFMDTGAAESTSDATGLDSELYLAREHRAELFASAQSSTQGTVTDLTTALERIRRSLTTRSDDLVSVRTRIAQHIAVREQALRRGLEAAFQFDDLEQAVLLERSQATVVGTDIPVLALDAYVKAAETTSEETSPCKVEWSLLAAIGKTESNHGRHGGARILEDGTTDRKIFGVALDGEETALIVDSDAGRLDGLATYDRAIGPMQFIPQTWQRFGTDATDDGVADPHNIYDAAQSTAEYLCASAPEVESKLGRTDALLTYNRSAEYGELVLERTEGYARIQLPFVKVPRTFLAAG